MSAALEQLRERALGIGADADDSSDERFRKRLLVGIALIILPAGLVWGYLYWLADELEAALLPWAYVVGSLASLAIFARTRSFAFFRTAQLLLVLVVPALLTVALGGLDESSGVILWSLLAPLGAQGCARACLPESEGGDLRLRIGISSGPVVAGVIGRRRFLYDLWGDTVNMASRMESHGEPDAIQITRSTWELVRDDFATEPYGVVDVKGKGDVETWRLVGPVR